MRLSQFIDRMQRVLETQGDIEVENLSGQPLRVIDVVDKSGRLIVQEGERPAQLYPPSSRQ